MMNKYCVLFVGFFNILLIQAQNNAGNLPSKSYSALPKEPTNLTSKSFTSNCGCIRVLTFDDMTTSSAVTINTIPNGYGGLNWVNAYYINTTWERITYGWNGYATALSSGIFVGFNGFGGQMSMNVPLGQYFQLNSLTLSAAWNSNLMVTIRASRANIIMFQTVVNLQVTSKTTLYTLKWSGIDKVTFDAVGGTPYPNLNGQGTNFVVDDIDISI